MKKADLTIHRGQILSAVAKRHKDSIIKIAANAGYKQASFYLHRGQQDLAFDILFKYAESMKHDFSNEIPGYREYLEENGLNKNKNVKMTYDELLKDRDDWREKYYEQLRENHKLITEKYKDH